jgi:hypothetical protein
MVHYHPNLWVCICTQRRHAFVCQFFLGHEVVIPSCTVLLLLLRSRLESLDRVQQIIRIRKV